MLLLFKEGIFPDKSICFFIALAENILEESGSKIEVINNCDWAVKNGFKKKTYFEMRTGKDKRRIA